MPIERKRVKRAAAREESGGSYGLVLCSLAFAILGIASWYIYYGLQEEKERAPPTPPVQVRRKAIGSRSYREIAELRQPVILTGTVADRWRARKEFTTSFLARKLPHVMVYKQESKRSFITFHDGKPLEPLVDERWEDFNVKVNSTIPEILQWGVSDRHPLKGPYMYFSQDIATLRSDFPDITGYVQPISDLILSEENVQVNLWVGRAGLITHTHYDCTYNFFVQLQGRKRFTLFPPNQTLYLYPCLHPHYGHSQVDILQPDLNRFPLFDGVQSMAAEVGAGDMLVVPPFWFHHVETLEESVSVNVWSDAPEYALVNEIYGKPIPFEEEWEWEERAKATKIYTDMILAAVGVEDTGDFIHELLFQRYNPVVQSGDLYTNRTLLTEVRTFCSQVNWDEERLHYQPLLGRGIRLLAPLFLRIPTRATMKICVQNYVEHLVNNIVGLEYVYSFLSECALL